MMEKYYTCTLMSDIVLNASLATECNMETLDHIPGSNFLGIIAKAIYSDHKDEAYNILHFDKVSFGDAIIACNDEKTFSMPFSYLQDKSHSEIEEDPLYIDYLIDHKKGITDSEGRKLQLKQKRTGFITQDGKVIEKTEKTFALKSAQDRETRGSKDGAMFGFESLKAGQRFIFSIRYENDAYIKIVEKSLLGNKRIGKSKSAQYGQVKIDPFQNLDTENKTFKPTSYSVVYAESNLCFVDESTGQATLHPTAEQLCLPKDAKINWDKSQIRVYSYSPWNSRRNTTGVQRHCIAKGSVFYIDGVITLPSKNKLVGEYIAEGFGRVIYNPEFLEGNAEHKSVLKFEKFNKDVGINAGAADIKSPLGIYLNKISVARKLELEMSQKIQTVLTDSKYESLKKVSPSQWGGIRAIATNNTNMEIIISKLFGAKDGFLMHGVSYDKIWGKNRESKLKLLKDIINDNKVIGSTFVAKLAAEFAKISKADDNE